MELTSPGRDGVQVIILNVMLGVEYEMYGVKVVHLDLKEDFQREIQY